MISKIDGCNQMWCTQCHVAFDWKTGAIQNSVHNPHYFEWLRKNKLIIQPVIQEECLTNEQILDNIISNNINNPNMTRLCRFKHQLFIYSAQYIAPNFDDKLFNLRVTNSNLLDFLLKDH